MSGQMNPGTLDFHPQRVKVICFDWNGTLADAEETAKQAFLTTWTAFTGRWEEGPRDGGDSLPQAERLYRAYQEEWRKRNAGRQKPARRRTAAQRDALRQACFEATLSAIGLAEAPVPARRFFASWQEEQDSHPILLPHAREVLEALSSRYRLAVLSNGRRSRLLSQIRSAGLLRTIPTTSVFASSDLGARKPKGAAFRRAMQAMRISPEQAVMVGDSLRHDIQGAIRAGMSVIWLPRSPDKKKSPPPSAGSSSIITIDGLIELPKLFRIT